jgi:hypothetical protein
MQPDVAEEPLIIHPALAPVEQLVATPPATAPLPRPAQRGKRAPSRMPIEPRAGAIDVTRSETGAGQPTQSGLVTNWDW